MSKSLTLKEKESTLEEEANEPAFTLPHQQYFVVNGVREEMFLRCGGAFVVCGNM